MEQTTTDAERKRVRRMRKRDAEGHTATSGHEAVLKEGDFWVCTEPACGWTSTTKANGEIRVPVEKAFDASLLTNQGERPTARSILDASEIRVHGSGGYHATLREIPLRVDDVAVHSVMYRSGHPGSLCGLIDDASRRFTADAARVTCPDCQHILEGAGRLRAYGQPPGYTDSSVTAPKHADHTYGLSSLEQDAIAKAAELWGLLTQIVGDGPTRDADLTELIAPIHLIQRYIASNAAARVHPDKFRALGETIHG